MEGPVRTFSFLILMHEIFKKGPANINKIQHMGLLAVKIAQMFALRIDFLSAQKCSQLSTLLQNNTTIDELNSEEILQQPYMSHLLKHLKAIDMTPFASASVAQVHLGVLESGDRVAIKILKQDYVKSFEKDLKKVIFLFRIFIFFYPKLMRVANPIAVLKMIEKDTLNELDLRREYQHHSRLRVLFEEYRDLVDLADMGFQRLYPEYSEKEILVSDLIDGKTFETLMDEGALSYDVLLRLFHLQGFFMFCIGEFHGDLHPGNVMYARGSIYFIDCGALGTVEEQLRNGLFSFMKFLSQSDFASCAEALHDMSDRKIEQQPYEVFEQKFLELYKEFPDKTVSQVSLTMQMMKTIQLGVHSGMSFSKGMFPVIKSLMYLDGMVRRVNPNAILMKDIQPFVEEFERYMQNGRSL
jgi:ubiquinone biosynthesis protein